MKKPKYLPVTLRIPRELFELAAREIAGRILSEAGQGSISAVVRDAWAVFGPHCAPRQPGAKCSHCPAPNRKIVALVPVDSTGRRPQAVQLREALEAYLNLPHDQRPRALLETRHITLR